MCVTALTLHGYRFYREQHSFIQLSCRTQNRNRNLLGARSISVVSHRHDSSLHLQFFTHIQRCQTGSSLPPHLNSTLIVFVLCGTQHWPRRHEPQYFGRKPRTLSQLS